MRGHTERVDSFRSLHTAGCFVMMNPWDVGSAKAMEQLGFPALASTSAGLAWTLGKSDDEVTLEETLDHARTLVCAVSVPITVDFRSGFADRTKGLAVNVSRLLETGAAGISIEDSSGDSDNPLYAFEMAVERVAAAHSAVESSNTGVVLTARSEGFVCGRPDIDETIRRLQAYSEAGADCLYAPRISDHKHVAAIVAAVAPKPVNLLINSPFISVAEAEAIGVRRISVGGTLARSAWAGALEAAREVAAEGTFSGFTHLPDVESLFKRQD